MSRDMTIVVMCDLCSEETNIDLDDGHPWDDYEIRIEKALERDGWYSNMDGDYCPKCSDQARKEWSKK
jgi:hypothetical protein